MLRKIYRKEGQSIIEYALLISVISLAFVAMQTYLMRAVQGRLKQVEDELNEPLNVTH